MVGPFVLTMYFNESIDTRKYDVGSTVLWGHNKR